MCPRESFSPGACTAILLAAPRKSPRNFCFRGPKLPSCSAQRRDQLDWKELRVGQKTGRFLTGTEQQPSRPPPAPGVGN